MKNSSIDTLSVSTQNCPILCSRGVLQVSVH